MINRRTLTKPIPAEALERVAPILRVLGHPHRLRITELLVAQELTVGQLAERLDIPHNACSQHLNLMRAHGLLASRRDGKTVCYHVDNPGAVNIITCIRNHELAP
ncbi:MAG TPA: metalloregulator ArsR/SmtB family transcription factor [Phycisphaerae bacterium]|nr:metalloregulator ArsR/SmtB family transcription factor [Phycisphaerae bacterium]